MVPGAESAGLVAPIIFRVVETALGPFNTSAITGDEVMKLTSPW
jgi:hypothetical protein